MPGGTAQEQHGLPFCGDRFPTHTLIDLDGDGTLELVVSDNFDLEQHSELAGLALQPSERRQRRRLGAHRVSGHWPVRLRQGHVANRLHGDGSPTSSPHDASRTNVWLNVGTGSFCFAT